MRRIAFVRLALAFLAVQRSLILLRLADAAGVGSVVVALEMNHAIQASVRGASTLVAMLVQRPSAEVSACLVNRRVACCMSTGKVSVRETLSRSYVANNALLPIKMLTSWSGRRRKPIQTTHQQTGLSSTRIPGDHTSHEKETMTLREGGASALYRDAYATLAQEVLVTRFAAGAGGGRACRQRVSSRQSCASYFRLVQDLQMALR